MDASASIGGVVAGGFTDKESMVDPFLVEALQNPRHRLTSQYFFYVFTSFESHVSKPNFDLI